jgi:putative hydrolase of the HAD superfamily
MPATIQAVTFDVGGTLIDPHPSVGHVYAEIAAGITGFPLDAHLLERRFRTAWKAFPRQLHSAADWAELVDEVFRDLVPTPPSQSFFPRLYARFSDPDVWRVHDDVLPTLEGLRREGIRTAVLSNWDERLRPLLQRLQLAHYFDPIIVSCEVGTAKPDPAIFRFAAEALDLSPDRILHVGDDPSLDLAANRAGFHAVLIDRDHPDCALPHIHALTRIVEITRRHFSQ